MSENPHAKSGREDGPEDRDPKEEPVRLADELETGEVDPGELDSEPAWWDEGADDAT